MSRPVVIDDAELLKVARQLFLEKGFGVSTAEMANKLGIAQGSIFRRYKTKRDLFKAAMLSEVPPFILSLSARAQRTGLRSALEETALEMIAYQRKVAPAMLMGWSNRQALGKRPKFDQLAPIPPAARELIQFIAGEMGAGRLRKGDPETVAFSLLGACIGYVLVEIVRGEHPIPRQRFVVELVATLWNGIAPKGRR